MHLIGITTTSTTIRSTATTSTTVDQGKVAVVMSFIDAVNGSMFFAMPVNLSPERCFGKGCTFVISEETHVHLQTRKIDPMTLGRNDQHCITTRQEHAACRHGSIRLGTSQSKAFGDTLGQGVDGMILSQNACRL